MIPPLALVFVAAQANVVTLEEALKTARERQPQLMQAHANTGAAEARAGEARAGLLPQVNGTAAYERTTSNFVAHPGFVPGGASFNTTQSLTTYNFFNFGLNAQQLLWDFGLTLDTWRAAKKTALSQEETERATRLLVELNARSAYFNARAQKELVVVAQDNLGNQRKHLTQVEGFVAVGTHPEIDLAQSRTDVANAKVQLINAENAYESAKATLNQAMGVEGPTDYDVAAETLPPLEGEDLATDRLLVEAVQHRPELASLERQIEAAALTVHAQRGAYFPSFSTGMAVTAASTDITDLGWNGNLSLSMTWGIFQGLLTRETVREARYKLTAADAARDLERQQIRLEVDQARLAVRAAKEAISAADEALFNAKERLRLAEGRYQTGVGNIIELGDAQLALTQAAAQKVQADFNLATARAQLLKALGRS